MKLREFMQTPVFGCAPTATLATAARDMEQHNVGSLLVTDDSERIVGIVTDRDIALAIGRGRPASVQVEEIMNRSVATIDANADAYDAASLMNSKGVWRLPVADPSGRAVGMISLDDLFGYLTQETLTLSHAVRAHGVPRL